MMVDIASNSWKVGGGASLKVCLVAKSLAKDVKVCLLLGWVNCTCNKGKRIISQAYLKGVVDKRNGGSDAAFGGLHGCQGKGPDFVLAPDCLQKSHMACHQHDVAMHLAICAATDAREQHSILG